MYFLCLYFFAIFPLPCDASLRGIQDGISPSSFHRKLERIGHGAPETNEYIVLLNQRNNNLKSFETRVNAVGGKVLRVYRHIFHGASIEIDTKANLLEILDDEAILMATAVRIAFYDVLTKFLTLDLESSSCLFGKCTKESSMGARSD